MEKEHGKKQRKCMRLRTDGEDQEDHLTHRKWTVEPHKASFLHGLAAVEWKRHC